MRLSSLWIFSILLTTGEALLMCGSRDYRSCDQYSNDSEEAYRCLKTLKPFYKRCNVSETLCTSTQFTFSDNSTFKQQGCVSVERRCQFTAETHYKISILTNRSIDGNVTCTFCKVSGCNSIQELGDNFGCYVVNETRCINDFNGAVMSQPIHMAQHQTLACLIDTSPVMCGNKENLCLSKTFTFDNGERLVLKSCVSVRNKKCIRNEDKFTMQNIIGKNVISLECDSCQTDFCNNQTVFVKPAIRCYYSNFEKCNQTKKGDNTEKQQNDTYNCIKRVKPSLRNCQEGCMAMLLTVEDNVTLAMHMCHKPNMTTCQLKNGGAEFGFNIGKKIMKHSCRICRKDWCNNETTILPKVPKPLKCYHSDLDSCMSIVRVITDFDSVLRCLTEEMNKNLQRKICDLGLKCTTIVFTMESYGKAVEFATCGSGPKSKCEKDAYETHFDRFVGQPIKHIECKYCETDYCNNVTVSLEGSIRPLSSKRDVPCKVNQIFTCEHSPLKEANEERKFLQEKVFKCLKDSSLATEKCQICLTVKYKFHHKEDLVLKMCGDNDVRDDFDISGSRKCDLKKNQDWFKEFTGKKLISLKCNPCDTDFCNEKKASKKSLEVPNEARELMPNIAVIVFTTLFLV